MRSMLRALLVLLVTMPLASCVMNDLAREVDYRPPEVEVSGPTTLDVDNSNAFYRVFVTDPDDDEAVALRVLVDDAVLVDEVDYRGSLDIRAGLFQRAREAFADGRRRLLIFARVSDAVGHVDTDSLRVDLVGDEPVDPDPPADEPPRMPVLDNPRDAETLIVSLGTPTLYLEIDFLEFDETALFQIATDADFTTLLRDRTVSNSARADIALSDLGTFYWRAGITEPGSDTPDTTWSSARSFTLIPESPSGVDWTGMRFLSSATSTADGGMIVVGVSGNGAIVQKRDASLDAVWSTVLPSVDMEAPSRWARAVVRPDGSIIVSYALPSFSADLDARVAILDGDGTILQDEPLSSRIATPDDRRVLAATSTADGVVYLGTERDFGENPLLYSVALDGSTVVEEEFDYEPVDADHSAADGDLAFVTSEGSGDALVWLWSPATGERWQRSFSAVGDFENRRVARDDAGRTYVGATLQDESIYLAACSPEGTLLWEQVISADRTGDAELSLEDLTVGGDGLLYATGRGDATTSFSSSGQRTDSAVLVSVRSDGSIDAIRTARPGRVHALGSLVVPRPDGPFVFGWMTQSSSSSPNSAERILAIPFSTIVPLEVAR